MQFGVGVKFKKPPSHWRDRCKFYVPWEKPHWALKQHAPSQLGLKYYIVYQIYSIPNI